MHSNNKKRYQDCSIIEKIWRRRWYLMIPIYTIDMWHNNLDMPLKECYAVAIGLAQCKMLWLYDWEEVKSRLFKNLK